MQPRGYVNGLEIIEELVRLYLVRTDIRWEKGYMVGFKKKDFRVGHGIIVIY